MVCNVGRKEREGYRQAFERRTTARDRRTGYRMSGGGRGAAVGSPTIERMLRGRCAVRWTVVEKGCGDLSGAGLGMRKDWSVSRATRRRHAPAQCRRTRHAAASAD